MKKPHFLITLLIFFLLSLSGCSDKQSYKRTRFYMGTTAEFNIPIGEKGPEEVKGICDIAESEVSQLDAMLSIFDNSSTVAKINNDNKKSVIRVSPELFRLIKKAKEYFILTQGAFDITVEPLTEIWGFGPKEKMRPGIQAIQDALDYVGFDNIDLDEQSQTLIFKDPRLRIDFGGLAKGYAVDKAVKIFKRHGITKGIVNIGGDLYCLGTNLNNKDWAIGIRDPEDKDKILAVLQVQNKAIATSGSYENFYIYNDKRYTHIIDPRAGYPISNNLRSVTIIADDCTTADILATAVFVLGETRGLEIIEKMSDIECFLIANRGGKQVVLTSSGMRNFIEQGI